MKTSEEESKKSGTEELEELSRRWSAAWPKALAAWSRFTRLRPPVLCHTGEEAKREGLEESFAMIRLHDQAIIVNLADVTERGLGDYGVEILAHEIGHHVLAPATLTDHARLIARMRFALPTVEQHAPMMANLYTDLLINNRLYRGADLRLADVYRKLRSGSEAGKVWVLYMRIYEMLWGLERGSLGGQPTDDRMEGDALLGARLLRSYALDWLDGAGRFAMLLLPYFISDKRKGKQLEAWFDTHNAGRGGEPAGLTDEDPGEREGAIHPSMDPELADLDELEESAEESEKKSLPADKSPQQPARGQAREPFQYGEILRASGLRLSDHDIAVRYYRERARPHLVPFPSRRIPESTDPLPEGLEPWDIGHPIDAADWLQSVLQSPAVIPGFTTVQRVWGATEGRLPRREPADLDIYVDSSGSMANPQVFVSYPALAGAILCLSALRAGARIQATLWAGKHQVTSTKGFVRNEEEILRVLTGYFGGGTAFPIHVLRDTYGSRKKSDRPVHILAISDEGVTTLFDTDEKGGSGWDIAAMALSRARGGGTFVLNMPREWERRAKNREDYKLIRRARDEQGWDVYPVADWEDLIEFARKFSLRHYGEEQSV
ncbi:MAG: VWA domain-containing protein [Syntrophobacteraceae bacterium]